MAQKKEGPTLEMVSAVAEKIARDKDVTVAEVTGNDVMSVLGKGSDGYIYAHLQTVKLDYIHAMNFKAREPSHRLMATLNDECAELERKTEERVRAEMKVTQALYTEMCQGMDDLTARLAGCEQESERQRQDHAVQLQLRDDELDKMRDQNTKLGSLLAISDQARVDATEQLSALRFDQGVAMEKLARTEGDLTDAKTEIGALEKRLHDAEGDRDKSLKTSAEHEQRAQLLNWQNDLREKEIANLKTELADANRRAADAAAQLEVLKARPVKPPVKNGAKQSELSARN